MQSVTNPSPDFRWARVAGPHLKVLDRYLNIQPWHNNRVKLQVPDGQLDYINASPISLAASAAATTDGREPDRYIAMQGPKAASTDHTWRMAVEQLESPGVIVMLTETHEGHLEKCYPYFPRNAADPPLEINERDEFGDGFRATVRCEGIEDTPAGDAIELRKLVVRIHPKSKHNPSTSTTTPPSPSTTTQPNPQPNPPPSPSSSSSPTTTGKEEGGGEEKTIYHLLYKNWPDFGVPSLSDLDSFFTLMSISRDKNSHPSNPRIVHCSAGVGRSGTFIALEHLVRELEAGTLEGWDDTHNNHTQNQNVKEKGGDSGSEGGSSGSEGSPVSVTMGGTGGGRDLVFETVDALREQRRTMVQAEGQFLFIYRVLKKLWVEKYWGGREWGQDDEEGEGQEEGDGEEEEEEERTGRRGGEPAKKRVEVERPAE